MTSNADNLQKTQRAKILVEAFMRATSRKHGLEIDRILWPDVEGMSAVDPYCVAVSFTTDWAVPAGPEHPQSQLREAWKILGTNYPHHTEGNKQFGISIDFRHNWHCNPEKLGLKNPDDIIRRAIGGIGYYSSDDEAILALADGIQ